MEKAVPKIIVDRVPTFKEQLHEAAKRRTEERDKREADTYHQEIALLGDAPYVGPKLDEAITQIEAYMLENALEWSMIIESDGGMRTMYGSGLAFLVDWLPETTYAKVRGDLAMAHKRHCFQQIMHGFGVRHPDIDIEMSKECLDADLTLSWA